MVAIPLTFLEVSAAGNTDRLKDTVIDKTIEKFEDGELITLMKVKMQLSDTLWAWCMVSSDGVEIFETNIHWDFDKMTRITAMHLHDLWRLKQDGC